MALETLKGVEKIGGFDLVVMDDLREKYPEKFNESGSMDYKWFEKDIRPNNFVYVRHDKNSLSFTIQDGPIKENGVNGCQVDTLIHTARHIITKLNDKYPCEENGRCVIHLSNALHYLDVRKKNREKRGVEGYSKG